MIACLDVDYRDLETVTACVGIAAWTDGTAAFERTLRIAGAPQPYEPGRFYLREMPHLGAMLEAVAASEGAPECVIIDGYVWLARELPGLGAHLHAHLHERLGKHLPIVGVAKTAFRDNDCAIAVDRGQSARPVYVTAIGCELAEAAARVRGMHGAHRLPTVLKRVDRLARTDRL